METLTVIANLQQENTSDMTSYMLNTTARTLTPESLKPMKFSKIDNCANKLIFKFKKLGCAQNVKYYMAIPLKISSNQYGGTSRNTVTSTLI